MRSKLLEEVSGIFSLLGNQEIVSDTRSTRVVNIELWLQRAGENRAVWTKATKSVGIADPMEACAVWDGSVVDRLVGSDDRCHS